MAKNRDLHEERLATTDENGHRVYLHPEDVKGFWVDKRKYFYQFLIFIFLVLPWIYVNGKPLILLNIPGREFLFFGTTFYGHDAPLMIFFFLGFILSLAAITAVFGRVWCGWACPQTVFIQAIFMKIERFIEGNGRARKKLESAPWSGEKFLKKSTKWILFTIVSLHISHSFLGYFVGARELFFISLDQPEEHMTLFITMLSITLLVLVDFGWFREQFCIIACPYGRIQSVFMDEDSYIVGYDYNRGEPRRAKDIEKKKEGDCIDCGHCVKACPTGIDIRRGTQLECIACTLCIDACDTIMEKVDKPLGLIRYTSENELEGKKTKIFKPRTFIYIGIIIIIAVLGVMSLRIREGVTMSLQRGSQVPYQEIIAQDKKKIIVNHYRVSLNNGASQNVSVYFKLVTPPNKKIEVVNPQPLMDLVVGHSIKNIFFKFSPDQLLKGNLKVNLEVWNKAKTGSAVILKDSLLDSKEINLVGPYQ